MPGEGVEGGPEGLFGGGEDGPAVEGDEVAGDVGGGAQVGRDEDGVGGGDGEQALVEGPVAEAAERHAVAWIVVVAEAPRLDVGGVDDGVAVGGEHADAA